VAIVLLMLRVGRITELHHGIPWDITYDIVPAAVFAAMILAVILGPDQARAIYTNPVCRFLGDTSYGVYLWHMVLIQVVFRWTHLQKAPPVHSLLVFLGVVLPGSLLLGWLSFRFVERPLSLYARRVWLERQPAAGRGTSGAS
jgi:peptidoglycan/LPS O-acetylase OafA/YrhL